MKYASLPEGMEAARCWCGDIAKVKESTDFLDRMGIKIFMCANFAHHPPESSLMFYRPTLRFMFDEMTYLVVLFFDVLVTLFPLQSPLPLYQWYHWIDTEQPAWALREIEERQRRGWARFHEEEQPRGGGCMEENRARSLQRGEAIDNRRR
jgi:hypothetical protein